MFVNLVILFASFYVLVKAADYFVESSSSIAKRLGVSDFIIGLTLVAIGTSIPELASSLTAAFSGSGSLVIGNIIGSNIANIALVIGISAFILPIKKMKMEADLDGVILLFITTLFVFALSDFVLVFYEGVILIVLYFIYLLFLFESSKSNSETKKSLGGFVNYVFLFGYLKSFRKLISNKKDKVSDQNVLTRQTIKDILILIGSLVGIVIGAKYLISEALFFGRLLNISEAFIGLSLIALGTSLPELSVTISAIKKGYSGIAVGNIIGSNIANMLLVGGVSALFVNISSLRNELFIMIGFLGLVTALFIYLLRFRGISRFMGVVFIILYLAFIGISYFA
jgi:cation:H+ antiporter